MWIAEEPEEVRGQAGVTTDFYAREKRPSDTCTRRRCARSADWRARYRSSSFPAPFCATRTSRTSARCRTWTTRWSGIELFKADPSVHGFGPDDYPDVRRSDGGGEVAVVLEITPKPGTSWWYAKRRIYCGLESMAYLYSEEFDENGR